MTAVILKMLAESAPGRIVLLPALPREWPSGTVEGILCRGQIEIKRMVWSAKEIEVTLTSGKPQQVLVETPGDIAAVAAQLGNVSVRRTDQPRRFEAVLPDGEPVTLKVGLQ